jgi:hypothetical protein
LLARNAAQRKFAWAIRLSLAAKLLALGLALLLLGGVVGRFW